MSKFLARLAALAAVVIIALTVAVPAHAATAAPSVKPPAPPPADIASGLPGIDTVTGHWCDRNTAKHCRAPTAGEQGGTAEIGEGSGDKDEAHAYELRQLKKWQDRQVHGTKHYKKLNAYITKCLAKKDDHRTFTYCAGKGRDLYPPPAKDPEDWLKEKVSQLAGGAFEDLAKGMGAGVVWLLKQFAASFQDLAAINLADSGIGPIMGLTTALSTIVATFLLLIQWGRVAATQSGEAAATAILGLVKFGVILAVYVAAVQAALHWSHVLSSALIDFSFKDGGIEEQLQTAFGGLVGTGGAAAAGGFLITGSGVAPAAAGAVIVLSALALLAIFALWVEMLMRQAGIEILIVVMPLVLAGQVADATSVWWPRARSALIALILMEPTITLIFSIGFGPMSDGKGIQHVLVGLLIFVTAGFAWPVLARFIIVNGSEGSGSSAASGLLSTLGSSASSAMGGFQPLPSGAGTVAGGGYAAAVEADVAAHGGRGAAGARAPFGGGGSAGARALQGAGVVIQAAAAGKDALESSAASTASYAGLGPGASGGRHVVVNRRGGAASRAQPRAQGDGADVQRPAEEDPPQPQQDVAPPAPQPQEDPAPPDPGPGQDQ